MQKGFTLIELLVVVLIIGILSAVALPQYQKVVDKARAIELVTIAKAVSEAEESYFMANGEYTDDWDVLNVSFQGNKRGSNGWIVRPKKGPTISLTLDNASQPGYTPNGVRVSLDGTDSLSLWWGYAHNTHGWSNLRDCYAVLGSNKFNQLCQYLTGKKSPTGHTPSYNTYSFD